MKRILLYGSATILFLIVMTYSAWVDKDFEKTKRLVANAAWDNSRKEFDDRLGKLYEPTPIFIRIRCSNDEHCDYYEPFVLEWTNYGNEKVIATKIVCKRCYFRKEEK